MKHLLISYLSLFFILFSLKAFGQNFNQFKWEGRLEISRDLKPIVGLEYDQNKNLVFHSPGEGVFNMEVTDFSKRHNSIKFKIQSLNASFDGQLDKSALKGNFEIHGRKIPIHFKANKEFSFKKLRRIQEEVLGGDYTVEDVIVNNSQLNIKLHGSLTTPNHVKDFPTVILISGSGPNDRNQHIFGHKTFLVWADILAKNGIATLRMDDRGVSKSEGEFSTAHFYDFADDVNYAIDFLKNHPKINSKKIGLMGHSYGADVASFVTSINKDVQFSVFMSVSGEPFLNTMLEQCKAIFGPQLIDQKSLVINNQILELVADSLIRFDDNEKSKNYFDQHIGKFNSEIKLLPKNDLIITELHSNISSKDYIDFFKDNWRVDLFFNPLTWLQRIQQPILVMNGSLDTQVLPYNLEKIAAKTKNKTNVDIELIPNANHLFQIAKTGLPDEYKKIEWTIEPFIMDKVVDWIKSKTER